jgi:hypothetical protein
MCCRQKIELFPDVANVQVNYPIQLGRRCIAPIDEAGKNAPASRTDQAMVSRLWGIGWPLIGSCELLKFRLSHIPMAASSTGWQSVGKHHVVNGGSVNS